MHNLTQHFPAMPVAKVLAENGAPINVGASIPSSFFYSLEFIRFTFIECKHFRGS
jgi:hypothetical protein